MAVRPSDFQADIDSVSRIPAVPTILEVISRSTGMRFAAVARVTEDRWVACSVLDEIDFGLRPGGELKVETTICHQIRLSREPVIIDNVPEDTEWRDHPCPKMYGFQSYISMPIVLADGTFFGTLCAIDPRPLRLRTPEVTGMFRLFAELIAKHLDADRKLAVTESALIEERALAELREQFIGILGHDLRTPMRAITCFSELLLQRPLDQESAEMARTMRDSAKRMNGLIENMLDLARGRLAGGLTVRRDADKPLEPVLREVIVELESAFPGRRIDTAIALGGDPVNVDRPRIAQLFSNLLNNALTYGSPAQPVRVHASREAEHFELSVTNAGDPIPPEALEHLFEPFFRNTRGHREGLGLGLYIAHEIAKAHGGALSVESSPEETRFTFRMPL